MKPVVALPRRPSKRLIFYLDDILDMNQTTTVLQRDISTAIHLIRKPRFCNNLSEISIESNSESKISRVSNQNNGNITNQNMTIVFPRGK